MAKTVKDGLCSRGKSQCSTVCLDETNPLKSYLSSLANLKRHMLRADAFVRQYDAVAGVSAKNHKGAAALRLLKSEACPVYLLAHRQTLTSNQIYFLSRLAILQDEYEACCVRACHADRLMHCRSAARARCTLRQRTATSCSLLTAQRINLNSPSEPAQKFLVSCRALRRFIKSTCLVSCQNTFFCNGVKQGRASLLKILR